jgi:hypothetical protein
MGSPDLCHREPVEVSIIQGELVERQVLIRIISAIVTTRHSNASACR